MCAATEIEIKVPVVSIDAMAAAIEQQGGKYQCTLVHEDHYFDRAGSGPRLAQTDEALRVRVSKDVTANIERYFLAYKGGKLDASTKTRKEIDLPVSDAAKAMAILAAIGFTEVLAVKKRRQLYLLEDVSILLDEVEGLDKPYMEVEIVNAGAAGDVDRARERLFSVLASLGIPRDASERRSYLELVLLARGIQRAP